MRPQLASIENEEENIFIDELLGETPRVWVGAKRLQDQSWIWVDGTEFSYKNFAPNEPNNSNGREDGILINWITSNGEGVNSKPKKWNDGNKKLLDELFPENQSVYGFICQYKAF